MARLWAKKEAALTFRRSSGGGVALHVLLGPVDGVVGHRFPAELPDDVVTAVRVLDELRLRSRLALELARSLGRRGRDDVILAGVN